MTEKEVPHVDISPKEIIVECEVCSKEIDLFGENKLIAYDQMKATDVFITTSTGEHVNLCSESCEATYKLEAANTENLVIRKLPYGEWF